MEIRQFQPRADKNLGIYERNGNTFTKTTKAGLYTNVNANDWFARELSFNGFKLTLEMK